MSSPDVSAVFTPTEARTGKPIELAMQKLWLVGRILPVGARVLVRHTFRSAEKKPLEAIYSFGLPRDAALRRFRITGEGFSVSSDLKPVEEAVKTYEEGLADGHLAALVRQYGDGMVNLTVGNIKPGEEVTVNLEVLAGVETRDDGIRFRFPFTLAPSYHSRARAAEVRPGVGEIELPADEFGDIVLPQFASDASALHEVGFDLSVVMPHPIVGMGSPSHALNVASQGPNRSRVSLATAKDLPDRDLVLDVRTKETLGGVVAGTGRDGRGYFAAVVPSAGFREESEQAAEEPRRVVFLLDRSGSMQGPAIEQARRAIEACFGTLGGGDSFGLVAFDDVVELSDRGLVAGSMKNREKASRFLSGIDARGGTELAGGLRAAAEILKKDSSGKGGDIVLVTDGQVAGTETIIGEARAAGIRIHCLGIGAASQDRFLSQLARETDGVSRFVTPLERVDLGALELFASIARPLGTKLVAGIEGFKDGRVAPEPPVSVFAGTPVVLFGDTAAAGEGRLTLAWEAGGVRRTSAVTLAIGPGGEGETLRLLQGARLITDLENRYPGGPMEEGLKGRDRERVRMRLAALSERYGLVSRAMGLVAVVKREGDRPGDIPVTRVVPVGLPRDMAWGAYFGDSTVMMRCMSIEAGSIPLREQFLNASVRKAVPRKRLFPGGLFGKKSAPEDEQFTLSCGVSVSGLDGEEQVALLELAAALEPDGGMPGKTGEERVLATVLALLRYLAAGYDADSGPFRAHVKRMIEFLEKSKVRPDVVGKIVERGRSGRALPGEWSQKKPEPALWAELEEALTQGS